MELIVIALLGLAVSIAIIAISSSAKNTELTYAQQDFIQSLEKKLKNQVLNENVDADNDEILIKKLSRFLIAYSKALGFDATQRGDLNDFKLALRQLESGNISGIQLVLTKLKMINHGSISTLLESCHDKLSNSNYGEDKLKVFQSYLSKSIQDTMSEVMSLVYLNYPEDDALVAVQDNITKMTLSIYKLFTNYTSEVAFKVSDVAVLFNLFTAGYGKEFEAICDMYEDALKADFVNERHGIFSEQTDKVFAAFFENINFSGPPNTEKELIRKIAGIAKINAYNSFNKFLVLWRTMEGAPYNKESIWPLAL